jgi:hypothetical protein
MKADFRFTKPMTVGWEIVSRWGIVEMAVQCLFTVVTNLVGLNFYEQKVPLGVVMLFQLFLIVTTVVNIYYAAIINNPKNKAIFVFIDFIQLGIPLIIRIHTMVRAARLKDVDGKLAEMEGATYHPSIVRRNQKIYFILLLFAFLMFLIKTFMGKGFNADVYNSSHFTTTILNAAGDLVYVYHMMCLKDHVKLMKTSQRNFHKEIFKILDIRRRVERRFSLELACTVSVYFIYIIVALYWIFIRIAFGYLKNIKGELNATLIINSPENLFDSQSSTRSSTSSFHSTCSLPSSSLSKPLWMRYSDGLKNRKNF